MVKIAPSILAADFNNLGKDIKMVEQAGADYIHFDVMDGMFVPNISFGIPVLSSLKKKTELPFDVHLMIERPERFIAEFIEAGADIITFHAESTAHVSRCIQMIKAMGKKASVALNPHTPLSTIIHVIKELDMVLLLGVNPGYGGQSLIFDVLEKAKELKDMKTKMELDFEIEIDGGVNADNAEMISDFGFDVLVAGSAVFGAKDRQSVIRRIKGL